MPTAVLDLEFTQLPPEISGLDRYNRAFALIRFRGHPVGKAWLPVVDGRISGTELRDALMQAVDVNFWEYWLQDYMGVEESGARNSSPLSATVAVCTRNRPEDLRRSLASLMRLPDDGQEFLVVDNCPSTDEARRIVAEYGRIRYVREEHLGASAARNRALKEAHGDIVAFIDDDAVPDPGWLRALLRNFDHPLTLCATGLTMPLELETEAQEWSERYVPFGRGFRRVVFSSNSHNPLLVAQVGASVNMALRRSVLEDIGSFDEALGPGTPTRSGEDHEMFSRILSRGYRIVYEPTALCWHRHRRTWKELRQVVYGYGKGVYAYWTKSLFVGRELIVPRLAWGWLRHTQLVALIRSLLRRPETVPTDLLLAELIGCGLGPLAYLSSRRRVRMRRQDNK